MKNDINRIINHRLKFKLLATMTIAPIIGCSHMNKQETIVIDVSSFKTLDQLIDQIKKSAGDRLPKNTDTKEIYRIFAKTFVDYAKDAISHGIHIPDEIIKKLPLGKKAMAPALAIFTLWGIKFVVPIAAFFEAILGSLAVMMLFILAAISDPESNIKKT